MSDRPVATDALATLGTIIDETAKRDAIHLAVIPAQAGADISSGMDVCIIDGKAYTSGGKKIGIVDPFLENRYVEEGKWFWLIIYPRKVDSLRHVWTHPDVPAEGENPDRPKANKQFSEEWLRTFCAKADCPGYDTVMGAIQGTLQRDDSDYGVSYAYDDEYLHFNGFDTHALIPPVFWDHVEVVLGKKVPHKPGYFSCSC